MTTAKGRVFLLLARAGEGPYADPSIQRWTKPLRGRFQELSIR
jgi:hypothetical protein